MDFSKKIKFLFLVILRRFVEHYETRKDVQRCAKYVQKMYKVSAKSRGLPGELIKNLLSWHGMTVTAF